MYSLSMKRLRFIGDPGRKAEMTASELVEIKRNIPMRPVLSIPTLALIDGYAKLPRTPISADIPTRIPRVK